MDVAAWLYGLGLQQYEQAFRQNAIDDAVLLELTADDLKDLGVSLVGHRRKLLSAIAALRSESGPEPSADARGVADTSIAGRRHLTVMFCDLVGSTALSASVTERLGLRLQRERFPRLRVGFNAPVCTFNVRNLLALDI
jgi:hypothetical protein